MNKIFLDLNKPAIDSAIEKLFEHDLFSPKTSGEWDLSNVLLVVPSGRIRREFLYQLLLFAQEKKVVLEIPQIVTIGRAPEFLYRQTRPFADDFTQNLAWYRAIKDVNKELFNNKPNEFLPSMPDDNDLEGQYLLGQMFSRLHQNLSAEMLDFYEDYDKLPQNELNIVKKLEEFERTHNGLNLSKEIERWKYFSKIKRKYLATLDEHNLWDVQVARRYALTFPQPGDFVTDKRIVLAGIVDLNRVQKAILQRVIDNVTALIYAPESDSDGFDAFGALNVNYWNRDLLCPLEDKQIIQVEKPEEQVLCALEYIRQLSNKYSPDQFTIGAPDDKIIPFVQSAADKLGLQINNTIGVSITSTAPYALLQAISDFLKFKSFDSFADLVRHPFVHAALSNELIGTRKDILSILDNFQQDYFPLDASSGKIKKLAPTLSSSIQDISMVRDALDWVCNTWLSDLTVNELEPKQLGQIIAKLFNRLSKDKSSLNLKVEALIINSCNRLENISEDFTGKLSPQSALEMILLRLQSFNLPNGSEDFDISDEEEDNLAQQESSTPMIRLAGWLELVWDRAPVLTILSFNEGVVPQSINSNLFLPNELRKELGILDNNRRFARDAYALIAMAASKKLLAICSQIDTADKAVLPSRLLYNKGRFIHQAYEFFSNDAHLPKFTLKNKSHGNLLNYSAKEAWQWAKENLSGNKLKGVVKYISATKFRDYIACPFRFYLKYVAGIQPVEYGAAEMEANSFGSFVHQVLQRWAQNELDSGNNNWQPDPEELSKQLNEIVDELYKENYPNSILPGIVIQKEIIKQRLKAFAEFQSTWEGKTVAVEYDKFIVPIQLKDKEEMNLIGKIDRIVQKSDGSIILLDYKTSSNSPEKDHREKCETPDKDDQEKGEVKRWINLQLPIYRFLFLNNEKEFLNDMKNKGIKISKIQDIKVGYINISQEKSVEYTDSEWGQTDFDSAEKEMIKVMEAIHNGVFWPPKEDVKYDAYQDYVAWLMSGANEI